jgi:hypothetical protein
MDVDEHNPVRCARCAHGYLIHTPGGGACLWWDPETGDHCDCPGFLHVTPSGPVDHPRSVRHYLGGQSPG